MISTPQCVQGPQRATKAQTERYLNKVKAVVVVASSDGQMAKVAGGVAENRRLDLVRIIQKYLIHLRSEYLKKREQKGQRNGQLMGACETVEL